MGILTRSQEALQGPGNDLRKRRTLSLRQVAPALEEIRGQPNRGSAEVRGRRAGRSLDRLGPPQAGLQPCHGDVLGVQGNDRISEPRPLTRSRRRRLGPARASLRLPHNSQPYLRCFLGHVSFRRRGAESASASPAGASRPDRRSRFKDRVGDRPYLAGCAPWASKARCHASWRCVIYCCSCRLRPTAFGMAFIPK